MILVLGGTTEGRKVVETLDKAGSPFFYSTKSELQNVNSTNGVRITGGLDRDAMIEFCKRNGIRMIVDAAHPFAELLHKTASEVADVLSIPVVRYEREYPARDERLIWCRDYYDAVNLMKDHGVKRLLALTGVQTISKLKDFWENHDCYFRILDREESMDKAASAGFPADKLLFYENSGDISNLINSIHPDAIITKESGVSGGFVEKVDEALKSGLKVFVVCRPELPDNFLTVTGPYGLRKEVEKFVPGFYKLRSGFTTGTCATAASKAALMALAFDEEYDSVEIAIPSGEKFRLGIDYVRVINENEAEAAVTKDAGDDPDVTNGYRIVARVKLTQTGEVRFFGGEGIGIVTLPGTGLEVGEPAINPVPRQMIQKELTAIYPFGCDVTISVPGGVELAKQTFNPRIGIEGGISIIGTSGIVMPFSNEAFLEAIRREVEVAKASGCERLVLNSGARSEKVVKAEYPALPDASFVHYGNAIGESLKIAYEEGIERLTVGLMIGKAVKLAEGNPDTHSHKVVMNREFLAGLAEDAGCSADAITVIKGLNMAKELWSALSSSDLEKFMPYLLSRCKEVCRSFYPKGELKVMLITDSGEIYCSK